MLYNPYIKKTEKENPEKGVQQDSLYKTVIANNHCGLSFTRKSAKKRMGLFHSSTIHEVSSAITNDAGIASNGFSYKDGE